MLDNYGKRKKTPGCWTISSFTTSLNNFNILLSDERKNVLDIMKMALKVIGDKIIWGTTGLY